MILDFQNLDHPSELDHVREVLELLAGTIQVDLPNMMGLKAYAILLRPVPPHVLQLAAMEILSTHKIRVLPLPAEILGTEAVREWSIVSVHWPRLMVAWKERLTSALASA